MHCITGWSVLAWNSNLDLQVDFVKKTPQQHRMAFTSRESKKLTLRKSNINRVVQYRESKCHSWSRWSHYYDVPNQEIPTKFVQSKVLRVENHCKISQGSKIAYIRTSMQKEAGWLEFLFLLVLGFLRYFGLNWIVGYWA